MFEKFLLKVCISVVFFNLKFVSDRRDGTLTLDQVINVARQMRPRSMAKCLEGTVKEILGTCQSLGCSVEGQHPHDIIDKIRSGDIKIPDEWFESIH